MTQSPNNMFFDMFKQFTDNETFANFQKNFTRFDNGNFTDTAQQTVDAMVKAGQVSIENGQAIAKRIAEVTQRNFAEAIETTRDLMSSTSPEQALQKQQQFIKHATTNAINNSKEVVEMASKSVMEVYDIFTKKFNEQNNSSKKGK